jgi:hypothetical protein
MKLSTTCLALVLAAATASAFAADATPAKHNSKQQNKMSVCAKGAHAKSLKGTEYRSYMRTCLKGDKSKAQSSASAASSANRKAAPVAH